MSDQKNSKKRLPSWLSNLLFLVAYSLGFSWLLSALPDYLALFIAFIVLMLVAVYFQRKSPAPQTPFLGWLFLAILVAITLVFTYVLVLGSRRAIEGVAWTWIAIALFISLVTTGFALYLMKRHKENHRNGSYEHK